MFIEGSYHSLLLQTSFPHEIVTRVHTCRAVSRHRDYWSARWTAAAGRQWTHATANTLSATGGGLIIWDSVKFGDISDGLSNLMVIGEQSDFGKNATGGQSDDQ